MKKLWALLFIQQIVVAASGYALLEFIRFFFKRNIHGAQDPLQLIDIILLFVIAVTVSFLSVKIYTKFIEKKGLLDPLGVRFSFKRLIEFLVGFVGSFILLSFPQIVGIITGTLNVEQNILDNFSLSGSLQVIFQTTIALLVTSFFEEITSRAFPIRSLQKLNCHLGMVLLLSSLLFALQHLIGEPFALSRIAGLSISGLFLALCYLITGNIWAASGVHTSLNYHELFFSGAWEHGSILKTSGNVSANLSIASELTLFCVMLFLGFKVIKKQRAKSGH